MKNIASLIILFAIAIAPAHGKLNYYGKLEAGYNKFRYTTVRYSEGGGPGYYLNNKQNGVSVNMITGINFRNRLYTGVGVGYLNFEGIHGISTFTDIELLLLKTRLTPLVNLRVGYNHIWNQYEGGKGTGSGELAAGASYRFAGKYRVYVQAGGLTTQQAYIIPVRAGFCIN